ncbi:hypothetical protein JW935_24755 [candidate division KSB1 bacterium]|nr:hypothetical protein [candidate division KSB1 bacterium]
MSGVRLGQLIAYLKQGRLLSQLRFNSDIEEMLEKLEERYHAVSSSFRVSQKVLDSMPLVPCSPFNPYLDKNEDFFLAYLLLFNNEERMQEYHYLIFQHLNHCYWCFEIFYNTLKDYYNTNHLLSISNN